MKQGGFASEDVAVAPTTTTVVEVDVRAATTLTLYAYNNDAAQTFSGSIQTFMASGQTPATSTMPDFSSVGPQSAVLAQIDVRGVTILRLVGTASGAGLTLTVQGSDREASR